MKLSRRAAMALLLAHGLALAQAPGAGSGARVPQDLIGRYYLPGVREMGGELSLAGNGRFQLGIAYGAVDLMAQGRWSMEGNKLELEADTPPPPSLSLGAWLPEFLEPPEKPILFEVKVTSPQLGLNWSNMEITAEFSNGRTRSGKTGTAGRLGFLARDDADWRGATIRRVSVAYPNGKVAPVWFDVGDLATKALVVHFEPGSLSPPPFKSLELDVERRGEGRVTLVQRAAEGRPLVFEK